MVSLREGSSFASNAGGTENEAYKKKYGSSLASNAGGTENEAYKKKYGSSLSAAGGLQSRSLSALGGATQSFRGLQSFGNQLQGMFGSFSPVIGAYKDAALDYDPQWLVDQAAMDTRASFDKSKGIMERNLTRYGINPNSGRFANMENEWSRTLAAAEAGAKTAAARQGYQDRITNLGQASQMGMGLISPAMSAMSSGGSDMMSSAQGYGGLASAAAALGAYNDAQSELFERLGITGE